MEENVLHEEWRDKIKTMPREEMEKVVFDALDMTWQLAMRLILMCRVFDVPEAVMQELLMMDDEMYDIAMQEYELHGAPGIAIVDISEEDDSDKRSSHLNN